MPVPVCLGCEGILHVHRRSADPSMRSGQQVYSDMTADFAACPKAYGSSDALHGSTAHQPLSTPVPGLSGTHHSSCTTYAVCQPAKGAKC